MPLEVVRDYQERQESSNAEQLYEAWSKHTDKIRRAEVRRVKVGRKAQPVANSVNGSWDKENEDEADWLEELVLMVLELASTDANGKRGRYSFTILGAAPPSKKKPQLGKVITLEIELGVAEQPGRETELLRAWDKLISWGGGMSTQNIEMAKALKDLVTPLASMWSNINGQNSEASKAKWEYETARMERENSAQVEIENISRRSAANERMHGSFKELFGPDSKAWPFFDQLFAYLRSDPSNAPTHEEIDVAFKGVDEDCGTLCKQILAETDTATRGEYIAALQKRWYGLSKEQRGQIGMQLRAKVGEKRFIEILLWMKSVGLS